MTQPPSPSGEFWPDLVPPLLPGAPPPPGRPSLPLIADGFRIDRERAPEAIRELEVALAHLKEIHQGAMNLGKVNPGSRDSVSIDAARALSAAAVGGPGSLATAVEAAIAEVQGLIDNMRAELEQYDRVEDGVALQFYDRRDP